MNIMEWLQRQSKTFHIIVALLSILFLGYMDYFTGFELRLEIFYIVPISYVAWFVGEKTSILFAVLSLFTIVCADFKAGKHFTHVSIEIWNGLTYLVFYSCVTLLLKFRKTVRQRESLIEDLEDTMRMNEELTALLPICSNCNKYRDDEEYRRRVTSYIRSHADTDFRQGMCMECSVKSRSEGKG